MRHFFLILLAEQNPSTNFQFCFFSVSSEKMSSCTIFCTIFSGALFFSVQISCYKNTRDISQHTNIAWSVCVFVVAFRKHRRLFTDWRIKKNPNKSESSTFCCGDTCSDMTVYIFHFRWFIEIEPKVVAAIIFYP